MPSPSEIVNKFQAIDAHDDTVENFRFVSARRRGTKAKVEVTLFRHWKNKRYRLLFNGCANVQLVLDADVLAHNSPNNTCVFQASTDAAEIEKVIRRQKPSWNVTYQNSIDPLLGKLSLVERLVLFKVRMFGGTLQVVARNFSRRAIR